MRRKTSVQMLAILLFAGVLSPHLLQGQSKGVPDDDNKLTAELNDELSDVEADDALVDAETVEADIDADLHKGKDIDYEALEAVMERDGTTVEKVVHQAVEEVEAEEGEHLGVLLAGQQVHRKAAAVKSVALLRGHVDHEKESRTFRRWGVMLETTLPQR
jgi:hypothetical protein